MTYYRPFLTPKESEPVQIENQFLDDVMLTLDAWEMHTPTFNSIQECWAHCQLKLDDLKLMCGSSPQDLEGDELRQVFVEIAAMSWLGARSADLEARAEMRDRI